MSEIFHIANNIFIFTHIKNKTMTIAQIKEHYNVVTHNRGKTLLLEDKHQHGRYSVGKFIVALERVKTGVYKVAASRACNESISTSRWGVLKQLIDYHVSRYDFDSEFYNPTYREGYFDEIAVHDYLREHLEFKFIDSQWGVMAYEKEFQGAYNTPHFSILLNISGLDSNETGFIERKKTDEVSIAYMPKGSSWVEVKCKRDAREICLTIDGLLRPIMLMGASKQLSYIDRLANHDIDPVLHTQENVLKTTTENIKKRLIEQLEETLKTLRGF